MNHGNTVGSREKKVVTWSRDIRDLQKRLKLLNVIQQRVLIGTLLGDACIAANSYGKNYRLKIEHCDKQREYVFWKYDVFRKFTLSLPKYQKVNQSWQFRTISHPIFNEYQKIFYLNGKKRVPINIAKLLTHPLSLAVWYMDDGALGPRKRGFTLNSQSFTKEENKKLQRCLKRNFNLPSVLHQDKGRCRIYIHPDNALKFKKTIGKFILPNLKYKILSL